ncbi:hypothetical protein [Pedobacter metabolipauper]|uniref:Uncharacterized protein n=1 Tax=Pedobacter metabolipauper TaxID=425513 RepID=A0A4R6SUH1_9SPHI|nr:hypothetical protein [Pedobacter metabolipauper]TDQ07716.1 hypothetical protein ATK78_3845 [Pedobacter metabolipauper]
MKNLLLGICFIMIFFIIIIWLLPGTSETHCILQHDFNNTRYIGLVKKKYIDFNEHSYPIVEILNANDSIIRLNLVLERNQIFNKIKVGDYIDKPKGTNTIFFMKHDKKEPLGQVDFGCN